jgi:SNF2 family DNA or RNA helicase
MKLYPFQETGVSFLLGNKRRLLADEMGLGKSFQSISASMTLEGNILIVCPASLVLQWGKMIKDIDPDCSVVFIKDQKEKVILTGKRRYVICSYHYLLQKKNVDRLCALRWHVIIADEAQALKSWTIKTAKGFRRLCALHTGYLWMMTGTPATKSGEDYYTYFALIDGQDRWGTLSDFRESYCEKGINWFTGKFEYKGVKKGKEKELAQAFSRVMLRRLKKDVVKELPPVIEQYVHVAVDVDVVKDAQRPSNEQIKKYLLLGTSVPLFIATELRSIGLGKVSAALEYIQGVNEPLVIGCLHTEVIEKLSSVLKCPVFSGAESREQKDRGVQLFMSGQVDRIIVNIHAGGAGLNLQRAGHMLVVEQHWSPAVMDQFKARIDRIGQVRDCVNITHLLGAGTIDEAVVDVQNYKKTFMTKVMRD